MKYIDKVLMPKEQVLFHSKLHWIIFTPTTIWLLITILIFTLCQIWGFFETILFDHPVYMWIGLIALIITAAHGLSTYLRYITAEYAITDKRVLMKQGLLHHHVLEIFLNKIESIYATQNVIGRLLNFGTITISGAGGNKAPFNNVPKPMEFRKIILEQISKNHIS